MSDVMTQTYVAALLAEAENRQANIRGYREYYDGEHATQLSDRQRAYLSLGSNQEFRSNYCPIVIDALVERLKVTGFACEGQDEQLWEWWRRNRMDAMQALVHLAAARDGDAYLLVGWDNDKGLPTFSFEPALCDGDGMMVLYADERQAPRVAVKRWVVRSEGQGEAGQYSRMNVYWPDRIERYLVDNLAGGQPQPYAEEGKPAVEPWRGADGTPLGIPVVHFANKPSHYNYGVSELNDVIPLQNALNKTLIDLMAAADTTAFRIYWMLGDDPSALNLAPGSWVYSTRPPAGENGASVGFFAGEDLSNLITLKDSMAIEIARVTRTPVSYFQVGAQRPAEGTLKQEESGLVGRVKDRQVTFGNCWEDAMALARRLANAYGGAGLDETQQIDALWDDPETRNDKLLIEGLQGKAALGVPQEQLWLEMGYDAAQIAEMQAMKAKEDTARANLGSELLRAFDRGDGAPEGDEAEREREPEQERVAGE